MVVPLGQSGVLRVGADADKFEGTLELGYQIGFPWSLGVGINFSYTTRNVALDAQDVVVTGGGGIGIDLFPPISTPPLLPGASISANLGNGPGICGGRDLLGGRLRRERRGGGVQRARHGDRCGRRCAAAASPG